MLVSPFYNIYKSIQNIFAFCKRLHLDNDRLFFAFYEKNEVNFIILNLISHLYNL